MNILNVLIQLRDDLKSWVTINLNALNNKIDEKTISIDNELDSTSTNPVQNKAITAEIEDINSRIGDTPIATQILDAIAKQPNFSGDYNDLVNAPNIDEDESGNLVIADESGNIILKTDADGLHTTALYLGGEPAATESYVDEAVANIDIPEVDFAGYATEEFVSQSIETVKTEIGESIESESSEWKIVDNNGNIIFKIDSDGAHTTNLTLDGDPAASKSYVDESISNIEFPETDLTEYATKEYVNDAVNSIEIPEADFTGYATEEYVNKAIDGIEFPETDLTDYYTKSETNAAIDAAKEELSESIVAESDEWKVVDEAGNIIFSVDADGAHTTALTLNGHDVIDIVDERVADLVDSAPDTLNTLNELAAALGDDPNFATTVATEIGKKVDKETGKGLSANDFTDGYKNLLDNLGSMAFEETDPTVPAWAKEATKPTYTAEEIGLGNVDNTSDADKPVSVATQTALDELKSDLSESIVSESEEWKVVDDNGNVIFNVDASGAHTTSMTIDGLLVATEEYVETYVNNKFDSIVNGNEVAY